MEKDRRNKHREFIKRLEVDTSQHNSNRQIRKEQKNKKKMVVASSLLAVGATTAITVGGIRSSLRT